MKLIACTQCRYHLFICITTRSRQLFATAAAMARTDLAERNAAAEARAETELANRNVATTAAMKANMK